MGRKKGVILSYILMIFEVLSTLLLTPFIIRTLGQAEYGVYKLSSAIVAYLLLLDLGVGNAIVRYVSKYRVEGDEEKSRKFLGVATIYYGVIAAVTLILGTVLVGIYPTAFATGLSEAEILLGQKLLGIATVNAAITLGTSAYSNVIVAYEKFHISKGASIIQIFLRMLLTVVVLNMGMGSIGILLVNTSLTLFCKSFYVIYVTRVIRLCPVFCGLDRGFIKEITVYSSFILLQMIATQVNACADQVLLGIFVPASAAIIAIYGVGHQITQYFQTIGTSVTGVLMPGVVKLVEEKADPNRLCGEMVRIGRIIFMVLGLIWVCFAMYGKQFISLWVGEENLSAYYVALMLMSCYVFILTEAIGSQILWAMNEHKEQSLLKITVVAVNIVLTVLLIKWDPLIGATVGTCLSLLIGDIGVMNLIFAKKIKIKLSDYYRGLFRGILPSLIVTGLVGGVLRMLGLTGWVGFGGNILVMVAVYGTVMLLYGMNAYEKRLFQSIIKKLQLKGNRKT